MKLQQIEVIQLFDRYDYTIDLVNAEHIKIITGPNGYGKSTIIRLIYHLYAGNLYQFFLTPFKLFSLNFIDSNAASYKFTIESIKEYGSDLELSDMDSVVNLRLKLSLQSGDDLVKIILDKREIETAITSNGYTKAENDIWWKNNSDEYLTTLEIIKNHPTVVENQFAISTDMLMFIRGLDALFISDQRLFYSGFEAAPQSKKTVHVNKALVTKNADTLKIKIQELKTKLLTSIQTSTITALNNAVLPALTESDYLQRLEKLNNNLQILINFGIAEIPQLVEKKYPVETARVLTNILVAYEYDIQQMLDEIRDIILFAELIKQSDFPDKTMVINTLAGYSFTNNKGTYIRPDQLSSGEQHKLILYFQLLFDASSDMLVLIDEPELSFHVIWQMSFIDELKQIIANKGLQLLVATHSPQIIDGKWSLTDDLFELKNAIKPA